MSTTTSTHATAPVDDKAKTEAKAPLTKPVEPKKHKPLDPNVVGEAEAEAAAEADKQAEADYEKASKEYEAEQAKKKSGKDASAAKAEEKELDPALKDALDNLYNIVHVPDQSTIEQTIEAAMAAPPASSTSSGSTSASGTKPASTSKA